jgi:hypothetical protein
MSKVFAKIIQHRIVIAFGMIIFTFYIIPHIPYVNIFFSVLMSIMITVAVLIAVGIQGKILFLTSVQLFFVLLFFTLLGETNIVELLGNAIYFIITIATFASLIKINSNDV